MVLTMEGHEVLATNFFMIFISFMVIIRPCDGSQYLPVLFPCLYR